MNNINLEKYVKLNLEEKWEKIYSIAVSQIWTQIGKVYCYTIY